MIYNNANDYNYSNNVELPMNLFIGYLFFRKNILILILYIGIYLIQLEPW